MSNDMLETIKKKFGYNKLQYVTDLSAEEVVSILKSSKDIPSSFQKSGFYFQTDRSNFSYYYHFENSLNEPYNKVFGTLKPIQGGTSVEMYMLPVVMHRFKLYGIVTLIFGISVLNSLDNLFTTLKAFLCLLGLFLILCLLLGILSLKMPFFVSNKTLYDFVITNIPARKSISK